MTGKNLSLRGSAGQKVSKSSKIFVVTLFQRFTTNLELGSSTETIWSLTQAITISPSTACLLQITIIGIHPEKWVDQMSLFGL